MTNTANGLGTTGAGITLTRTTQDLTANSDRGALTFQTAVRWGSAGR